MLLQTTEHLILGAINSDRLLELIIGILIPCISILASAFLAYRYALKRLKKETPLLLQRDLYNKEVKARQALWKLLKYTTDVENKKAIFQYEVPKGGKGLKDRTWFFITENGEQFREKVIDFFYGKGYGIFLSKELKELLFKCDTQIYGFLLSEKSNTTTQKRIQVKNNKFAEEILNTHNELLQQLKKEIKEIPNNI